MITRKSIIHFHFPITAGLFDARPIWNALKASDISIQKYNSVVADCGDRALSIVTRGMLMAVALDKLEASLSKIYHNPELVQLPGFVMSSQIQSLHYDLLLCLDSLVFEFRSYLDLMATFSYKVLD